MFRMFLLVLFFDILFYFIQTHATDDYLPSSLLSGVIPTNLENDTCENLPHSTYLSKTDFLRACVHRRMWMSAKTCNNYSMQCFNLSENQRRYIDGLRSRNIYTQRARRNIKTELDEFLSNVEETNEIDANSLADTNNFLNYSHQKVVRKEYRMLSDNERIKLNDAINALKRKFVDNITIWDLYTIIHYPDSAVGAHWGPAFLPWHREFLLRLEKELQSEVSGVSLPYWDSTLDFGLPDPSDSILWTEELLGNGNGYVRTGPFKDWNTNVFMPLSSTPIKKLFRSTGARKEDRLLSPQDVQWIISRKNYSDLTFCHDTTFESMHGLSHVWVGGFMYVIKVSPNDPVFYMHHAFIDYIWEIFRIKQQSRYQRENDYARKICNKNHAFNARMAPFNLKNRDGLSNNYTDIWYEYQTIEHCTIEQPFCKSKYLFCDNKEWRCRSRIQLGGNCTGFAGMEICYNSICIQNVCRIPATAGNGYERHEKSELSPRPSVDIINNDNIFWTKTLLLNDNHRALSSGIAHINVYVNGRNVVDKQSSISYNKNYTAFIQRVTHYPELTGTIYLPFPQPNINFSYNVTLEAWDHYGRYCQIYCLNGTSNNYDVCESNIHISQSTRNELMNMSFTHSITSRRFLDTDMSLHPSKWTIYTPFLVFACHKKLMNSSEVKENAAYVSRPLDKSKYVWFRVIVLRRVSSAIDLENMQIEAEDLDDPSETWIDSIKRARSFYDQSFVFVRARNPRFYSYGIRVRIAIRENGIQQRCDVKCNTNTSDMCNSIVRLHYVPEKSQEQAFVSDPAYLPLLGWRMVGHPNDWRLIMPYLSFYC